MKKQSEFNDWKETRKKSESEKMEDIILLKRYGKIKENFYSRKEFKFSQINCFIAFSVCDFSSEIEK